MKWDCGGDVPYCIEENLGEATCAASRPTNCSSTEESSDFECLAIGFFPDPLDCKTYYQCYDEGGGNLASDELKCDDFYVFDPSAPNNDYCRFTRNRFCVQVNCKGSVQNILLNYPFFPRRNGEIVATCRVNKKPLVTHCKAGFHANLKSLPVDCLLTCTRPSKFEFPGDETKYYDCVFTGRVFEGKIKSCYRNYFFNNVKKQCEWRPTQPTEPSTENSTIPTTEDSTHPTTEDSTIPITEDSTDSTTEDSTDTTIL